MIHFYDAEYLHLIPAGAEYVALYADGDYSARGNPLVARWPVRRRRWYTIIGDETCSMADYEPDNPIFDNRGQLHDWAHKRLSRAHRGETIVYCDRADAESAIDELDRLWEDVLWNIATGNDPAPSGNGTDWTAAELAADLAANWHAPIPAGRIWANQNVWTTGYDVNQLFGKWRA